jgi:hypothetical protein
VLPLAAVLRGLEVLHASAVVLDGRAVALAGACRAGKTSVAGYLAAAGAPFLTDDVLAVEPEAEGVLCHPGVAAANVRDAGLRALVEAGHVPFRGIVGRGGGSLRVLLARVERSVALEAIYFLDHGSTDLCFEATDDPYLLLGHTFNVMVRTPERLTRQLDVCSRVASDARMFRVRVPGSMGPAELASRIAEHVGERSAAPPVPA